MYTITHITRCQFGYSNVATIEANPFYKPCACADSEPPRASDRLYPQRHAQRRLGGQQGGDIVPVRVFFVILMDTQYGDMHSIHTHTFPEQYSITMLTCVLFS